MINPTPDTVSLWLANWNLSETQAQTLLPAGEPTVTMVDSIGASSHNIPTSTKKVGMYVTGSGDVPWTLDERNRFSDKTTGKVFINQSPIASPLQGAVDDVETGALTIPEVVQVCIKRRQAGRYCNIYISQANQAALETALRAAGFNQFPVVAVQWASPTSNPDTILPGTTMTLREANCDLSVALASWFGPSAAPPPPAKLSGLLVEENLSTHSVTSLDGGTTWKIS